MPSSVAITENFIDVEQLFAKKNPRLHKLLPGFIFTYIKKIVHQDELNSYIYRHRDKFGLDFIDAILDEFGVKTEVITPPPSPTGRYIIASNHPLGGMDGMALMQAAGKVRKDIVFPVNDLLTYLPGLAPLFIPINKHGKNIENIEIIENTFASDKMILYFPAGLVSRKDKNGIIRDLDWKKTFITKARKHKRDIIPVFITGRNTNFFYNLANLRTKLGIKANIEMLYLVDEMFKQRGNTLKIIFGQVIPYSVFDRSKTDAQWADYVKNIVYSLNF